jgi:hypothetical protein
LATRLSVGSYVAYDFKIRGVADEFEREGMTEPAFRLPVDRDEIVAFHAAHGLRVEGMELSSELCTRILPALAATPSRLFSEDGLLRLRVERHESGGAHRFGALMSFLSSMLSTGIYAGGLA